MSAERLLPFGAVLATALLVIALVVYGADPRAYWTPEFAASSAISAAIVSVYALILHFVTRRRVLLLAGAVALYLGIGLGPAAVLAALFAATACLLLGRRALVAMLPREHCTITAAMVCGVALYLALFGVMIHFPVNYRGLYFALLAAPFVLEGLAGRLPLLASELRDALVSLRAAADAQYLAFTGAMLGAVLIGRYGFIPTLGYDDNALHLGMWSQLLHGHVYEFDYVAQVWEVAPFAVDLMHAVVNLLAGMDARGATNVLLLAMIVRQTWVALGALQLAGGTRALILALFISTPLAGYSLLTMQTELLMALLAATGVRLLLELRGEWCSPQFAALLAVAALSCATKLPGAGLGVMLLAAAGLRLFKQHGEAPAPAMRSVILLAVFTLILAVLAFNAYASAWLKTGNPVFPLYNAIFESPYFPLENFTDERWVKGFSIASYWDLFFNTSGYFESQNFVAGFQFLLLFPLGLAALLCLRPLRAHAPTLLVPLFGYGLFVFAATQYWRYQLPVFPLAMLVIGALLTPRYAPGAALAVRLSLVACIVLNLMYYPGVTTLFRIAPDQTWTSAGKDALLRQMMPARALNAWINRNAPGSRVLYPWDFPMGATLDGTPLYVSWYSPARALEFGALRTFEDGLPFMRAHDVEYVVAWRAPAQMPGKFDWEMRRFYSRYAVPILHEGDYVLYRFEGTEVAYDVVFDSTETRTITTTPAPLGQFSVGTATAFRYSAEFACASDAGYFAAQINWDNGQFYYKEIACSSTALVFDESLPIPPGAGGGELWARVIGTDSATLTQLRLETL